MNDADLIRMLATRDAACPCCDHNLRGLTRSRCPECGTALVLSINPRTQFPIS